jgi:hypothetical protein
MTTDPKTATVDEALQYTAGFPGDLRDEIVVQLQPLNARLKSYPAGSVELRLFVKDFDTLSQKLTLEATIVGHKTLVSTSHHKEFHLAIQEVRDDLIRLMSDSVNKTEPRNNRSLRDKLQ